MSFQHVLITTDFSKDSLHTLEYLQHSNILSRHYTLLYILTDWDVPAVYYDLGPFDGQIQAWRDRAQSLAQDKINALLREYSKSRDMAGVVVQSKKSAAVEICDYALKHRCDLIMIGSKGAGAVASMILGSVVQKVVKHSPCPVLIVPHEIKIPNLSEEEDI